jgi:hypothetical protein
VELVATSTSVIIARSVVILSKRLRSVNMKLLTIWLSFLFSFVVLVTTIAYAQLRHQNLAGPPIRLETDLVLIDAQVLDRRTGAPVHGLGQQDFVLYEDRVRQVITHFSQERSPLSVVLLLDCSKQGRDPVLDWIRRDALEALQLLKPEDEVALMAFGERTEILEDFSKSTQLLTGRIGALDDDVAVRVGTAWDINEAIYQAASHSAHAANPDGRRLILAVTWNSACEEVVKGHTKGEARDQLFETGSIVCGFYPWDDIVLHGIGTRLAYSVANPIVLVAKTVQIKSPYLFNDPIGYYTRETGGRVAVASDPPSWPRPRKPGVLAAERAELAQFIERMREHYSLAYVSSNGKRDGAFRKVRLNISAEVEKRRGKLDVITRRGYYAR